MGRLMHLKQTLPQNVEDNRGYPHLTHLILDYHSQDGLSTWVEKTFRNEIRSGRVVYYHFPEPEHFNMAHAKNMAHRLAFEREGAKIACNVDADNFTGQGFASMLHETFDSHEK
jgi:hypothetical protein